MAEHRPKTEAELLSINGVGEAKLERYGDAFLEIITAEAAAEQAEEEAADAAADQAARVSAGAGTR